MFCFQSPAELENDSFRKFGSEKNLHQHNYKIKSLCHSDPNLSENCANAEERRTKKTVPSLKRCAPAENLEPVNNRKSWEGTGSSPLPVRTTMERNVKVGSNDLSSSDRNYFHGHDLEFIDESKTSSRENVGDDKDCQSSDKTGNCVVEINNQKSENCCLKNQTSISNFKVIKNNSTLVQHPLHLETESESNISKKKYSQVALSRTLDINSESRSDTNLQKSGNKSLKRQKINSGTSLLSLCSLFSLSKSPSKTAEKTYPRNNETNFPEQDASVLFQQNMLTTSLSCCPLSYQKSARFEGATGDMDAKQSNLIIINKSPKPKNKTFFSEVNPLANAASLEYKSGSIFSSSDSSSGDASSDGIAPMASPEVISPSVSVFSSPMVSESSTGGKPFRGCSRNVKDPHRWESNSPSSLSMASGNSSPKLKLLHEGDAQVCYLSHMRTIFRKVLSSKLLRRWETHHIYFREDCLCSKTPTGYLESPVPYSNLDEVYVVGRWDHGNRFCIRLVMQDGSLLLQTSNSLVRDQWLSSILWKKNMHKYRSILQTSMRPEVILKEIKALICSSLNSPLQDDSIRSVPIDIISKVLSEDDFWNDRQRTEEVIMALAPLLEDSTPSPEMFRFFSRHCLSHPRSPVVVDVFTSVVQRILKRTMDFGKSPLTRRFVSDYFKALHSQNDGDEAIKKFIGSVHGTSSGCPHPRVLPNLVAVNLAAVFSHFEQRKTLLTESANETNCDEALQLLDKQLECFVTLFLIISEYEDWRPGLAQLLQPIPFPDDALSHHAFVKGFIPVIRKIGMDPRCEVHETILGIRESKEGWLNVFCPSSLVCKDEGGLWCQMLETLFYCCCKRKSFLQKMVKWLGALLLVALRGHTVAQEMLCLMLEWRLLNGEDQEMQVVTTLQSNESGRLKYSELCRRQEHLRELQKEGGPKKLTLPSRSTDADVARLLSCGSFGNLECLSLAFTHVTSACAHQLIQLPALRYLNLWATQFGDAGLVIIAEHLDKLQVLNLCETPVSDKGIAAIAAMRSLKKLNLNSTKLSPQTLDTLKVKLPTLQELDVRYTDAW